MIWLACLIFGSAFAASPSLKNGEYVFRMSGCIHCHSSSLDAPLAGGRPLVTPFGVFYPPNITPDPETGIGRWTEADFFRALREGKSPNGSSYYPVFPYSAYTQLKDQDIRDLFAYIKSFAPIRHANPQHEIHFPFDRRWINTFWKAFFLSEGPSPMARGQYIAEAAAHCAECHTPRNWFGALDTSRWLAGTADLFPEWPVPNITPDSATGTGDWSREQWRIFLRSGIKPDGKTVGGEMARVMEGLSTLNDTDREALIDYLQALPPVRNRVVKK